MREHLPLAQHREAFDDPRLRMVFDDGRKFVADADARYDVVIIDVVDMLDNGPARSLYTRQFYELLHRRLRPGGLVVVQGLEFSFLDDKAYAALARTLRTVFPEVRWLSSPRAVVFVVLGLFDRQRLVHAAKLVGRRNLTALIEAKVGSQWLEHDGRFLAAARFSLCKRRAVSAVAAGTDFGRQCAIRAAAFRDRRRGAMNGRGFPIRPVR